MNNVFDVSPLELLTMEYEIIQECDTFGEYYAKFRLLIPFQNLAALNSVSQKPSSVLTHTYDLSLIQNGITIATLDSDYNEFIQDCYACFTDYESIEGQDYVLEVKIAKSQTKGCIDVFSFTSFITYLSSLPISTFLKNIANNLHPSQGLLFNVYDSHFKNKYIFSDVIQFAFYEEKIHDQRRCDKLEKIEHFSRFIDFNHLVLSPCDFEFDGDLDYMKNFENHYLRKVRELLSIGFLSDSIQLLPDKTYRIVISGFKRISLNFSESDILPSTSIYYRSFKWLFESAEFSDKLGIIRNLLTLHLTKDHIFELGNDFIDSLNSNYRIYLKENLQQYIDIKNKANDYLIEYASKLEHSVNTCINRMFTSVLGIITFIVTVIIMNAVNGNLISEAFTPEISGITICFSILTYGVIVFNWFIYDQEKKRLYTNFNSVKHSYQILLDENDLNRIFDYNLFIEKNLVYFNKRINSAILLWSFSVIVISATSIILSN